MNATNDLPPITIASCDYDRLIFTATVARRRGNLGAQFLLSELLRARRCAVEELPEDVVSTNCRVICRMDGGGEQHAGLLVYPEDIKSPGAELSVTSPLGTALLGLRIGDRMPYPLAGADPVGWRFPAGIGWRVLPR